jgi:signal transduction histidine kinase
MNKKILFKKFVSIWLTSIVICILITLLAITSYKNKLYESFLTTKENELKLLVQLTSNEILIGNFKNFRQKMIAAIEAGVIDAYQILDSANNYGESYPPNAFTINNSKRDSEVKISIPIFYPGSGDQWGKIIFIFDDSKLITLTQNFNFFAIAILAIAIGTILSGFVFYFRVITRWSNEFSQNLSEIIRNTNSPNLKPDNPWGDTLNSFYLLKQETLNNEIELNELKQESILAQQAKQVAHDIRSPLSALNLIAGVLTETPEEYRIIIRSAVTRINDIANALLEKGKKSEKKISEKLNQDLTSEVPASHEPELLEPIVSAIISEKRIQNRDKKGLEILSDFRDCYGAFANINPTELGRIISNLINNAAEAFTNSEGTISISIRSYDKDIFISISDNGIGIPESVLKRIGERGFSHGKTTIESGSGLGVHHAKTTIEQAGGSFQIQSKEGVGTMISIHLPKVEPPSWFLNKISLKQNSTLVSLDDDNSIHQIWHKRITDLKLKDISHLVFQSGVEFEKWYSENSSDPNTANIFNFLIDFELLNQPQSGLDLIEKLGIAQQSVLVTSRYDEPSVRLRCSQLKLKIIPKMMSGLIPIEIENNI